MAERNLGAIPKSPARPKDLTPQAKAKWNTIRDKICTDFWNFEHKSLAQTVGSRHQETNECTLETMAAGVMEKYFKFSSESCDKIKKMLPKISADPELHKQAVMIFGYLSIVHAHCIRTNGNTFLGPMNQLEDCRPFLEPLKYTKEGVFVYCYCLQQMAENILARREYVEKNPRKKVEPLANDNVLELLTTAEEVYQEYLRLNPGLPPADIKDIFGPPKPDKKQFVLNEVLDMRAVRKNIYFNLFQGAYHSQKNENMSEDGIQAATEGMRMFLEIENNNFVYEALTLIQAVTTALLYSNRLRQAQHFMAIGMHKVLHHRNRLPVYQRGTLDELLARYSLLFVLHGYFILHGTVIKEKRRIFNNDFEPLTTIPGVKLYENEFPTTYTNDCDYCFVMYNKMMDWLKQADSFNQRPNKSDIRFYITQLTNNLQGMVVDLKDLVVDKLYQYTTFFEHLEKYLEEQLETINQQSDDNDDAQ